MDSMEEIYKKHGKMIYGFLLTRTQDPGLAEELTQETFYQAVKHIGRYKGESSISTWLCAIAKNLWCDYLRRQKHHVPLEEADQVSVESAESQALCSWDNVQILRLIHGLEDSMREVMYLRLVGNLTFGQLGEIMGRSENWARVTYYRGNAGVFLVMLAALFMKLFVIGYPTESYMVTYTDVNGEQVNVGGIMIDSAAVYRGYKLVKEERMPVC